MKRKYFLLW